MKRESDEIRYHLLKCLVNGKCNIESIRSKVNTGLPTIAKNSKSLEKMGFIRVHEIKIGKRKYTEVEITDDGLEFLRKLKGLFEK